MKIKTCIGAGIRDLMTSNQREDLKCLSNLELQPKRAEQPVFKAVRTGLQRSLINNYDRNTTITTNNKSTKPALKGNV